MNIINKSFNKHINKEPKKIIYIDAFCMFGGIDIKWMESKKQLKLSLYA